MHSKFVAPLALLILSFFYTPFASANWGSAIKKAGNFVSMPSGNCTAALKRSSQGGFLQLYIGRDLRKLVHVADDVTAIAWATSSSLVYSVSPVYGSPGIFLVTCHEKELAVRLVEPEHVDKAYPQGSDYFELQSITGRQIRYYYGEDVDKVDFSQLRSDKNIRVVPLANSVAR